MSKRSPHRVSKDARRGLKASGSPLSTSPRSSPASGRDRCRAAATCSPVRVHGGQPRRRLARVDQPRRRRRPGLRRRPGAGALVLRRRRGHRPRCVRRLRARRPGGARFRVRQLRDARRQGQDRRRPPLLPRGCRPGHALHPRPLFRPALQGHGRAPARREGAARRHRAALAERRPGRFRCPSTPRLPGREFPAASIGGAVARRAVCRPAAAARHPAGTRQRQSARRRFSATRRHGRR